MMRNLIIVIAVIIFPAIAIAYPPVEEVTGKSGVKAWLLPVHNLPIINISIVFRDAGYGYDPTGKDGLASIVSDMLMEGAGKRNAEDFSATLDRHAITIGSDADTHDFSFHIKTLSRNKDLAFSLLKDMLHSPMLPEASLERLRPQYATAQKQLHESADFMAQWRWHQLAYPGHAYEKIGIGNEASVAAITIADIKNFMRANFARDNIIISVAGDIDAANLAEIIDDVFGALPASHADFTPIAKTTPVERGLHRFEMASSQSEVFFGLPGIERSDKDFYAMYVLNELLGGSGFMSILTEKIRQQKGLVYSISTQLDTSRASPLMTGSFGSRPEQAVEALRLLQQIFKEISDGDITEKAVEDAKTSLIGSQPLNTDTTAKLCGYLRTMQMENLGKDYLEKRSSYFAAVSRDDVIRVAKQYLNPEKLLIVIAGK